MTSFEQSKLDFASFILNTFKHNKCLVSFSLSLIKKNIILKGIKISDYHIFELSSISFNQKNNNLINNINQQFNFSPLDLGNIDLHFSCLKNYYEQETSNNKISHNNYNLHTISSKFSEIEQHIIHHILIKKNLYLNQTKYLTHFSSSHYKFNKNSLQEDINYFIGDELKTKQYTIHLFNTIKNKNYSEDYLLKTKL